MGLQQTEVIIGKWGCPVELSGAQVSCNSSALKNFMILDGCDSTAGKVIVSLKAGFAYLVLIMKT